MELTAIQKKMIKEKCPACKEGSLFEVEGKTEVYLWCDRCYCSVDSSGGYTD